MLDGSLEYHVDGNEPKTVTAGEALLVPADTVAREERRPRRRGATRHVRRQNGKPFLVVVE